MYNCLTRFNLKIKDSEVREEYKRYTNKNLSKAFLFMIGMTTIRFFITSISIISYSN
jgi:hypothetical protein